MLKLNELNGFDTPLLRSLAESLNLSYRYYGDKNKDDLLKIIYRKLDPDKRKIFINMYLMCYELDDIIERIKPSGMSEIVEAVEKFFNKDEYLHEVTVGSHRCDVIFFSDMDINAIEIKSSLDKINTAFDQLNYYKKWANKVYLAYDIKHKKTICKMPFKKLGIGLLEHSKGEIIFINKSNFQYHDKINLLTYMTYNYLRKIAKKYKVNLKGGKQDISRKLSEKITDNEAKKIFKNFLRARALI